MKTSVVFRLLIACSSTIFMAHSFDYTGLDLKFAAANDTCKDDRTEVCEVYEREYEFAWRKPFDADGMQIMPAIGSSLKCDVNIDSQLTQNTEVDTDAEIVIKLLRIVNTVVSSSAPVEKRTIQDLDDLPTLRAYLQPFQEGAVDGSNCSGCMKLKLEGYSSLRAAMPITDSSKHKILHGRHHRHHHHHRHNRHHRHHRLDRLHYLDPLDRLNLDDRDDRDDRHNRDDRLDLDGFSELKSKTKPQNQVVLYDNNALDELGGFSETKSRRTLRKNGCECDWKKPQCKCNEPYETPPHCYQ